MTTAAPAPRHPLPSPPATPWSSSSRYRGVKSRGWLGFGAGLLSSTCFAVPGSRELPLSPVPLSLAFSLPGVSPFCWWLPVPVTPSVLLLSPRAPLTCALSRAGGPGGGRGSPGHGRLQSLAADRAVGARLPGQPARLDAETRAGAARHRRGPAEERRCQDPPQELHVRAGWGERGSCRITALRDDKCPQVSHLPGSPALALALPSSGSCSCQSCSKPSAEKGQRVNRLGFACPLTWEVCPASSPALDWDGRGGGSWEGQPEEEEACGVPLHSSRGGVGLCSQEQGTGPEGTASS